MQDELNQFSDIPALGDEQALAQFLENQNNAATTEVQIPPALQQVNPVQTGNPVQPTDGGNPQQSNPGQQATFTPEQVQAIINASRQQTAQVQQPVVQKPAVQQTQPAVYSPQELNAIQTMLARGYSLEQVLRAVQSNRARAGNPTQTDPALAQKINNIEQYLAQQEYQAAQHSFIEKMTTFGDKFGLTENDLVTFGNAALAKGINLVNVQDVEMVFKAIYPEQYAIRVQRMSNTPTSQIYGGTSVPENSRAVNDKVIDAYVDSFLKRSMPNQYGMQKK